MNHELFHDNPPVEQQLAVLYERVGNFMDETRRAHNDLTHGQERQAALMTQLLQRETERNGHINELLQRSDDYEIWQNKHDDWHGPNDREIRGRISARLETLEQDHHDAHVRSGVWLSQWKALSASAACGAALTAIIAFLLGII